MDEDDIEIDLGFDDNLIGEEAPEEVAAAAEVVKNEDIELTSDAHQARQVSGADASAPEDEKPSTKAIVVSGSASGSSSKKEGFGNVVHIVDMAWYTTDIEVEAACSQFGSVHNVKFFEARSNGRSAGTCIVEFSNHEEAKACIDGLNKHKIGEREVHVSWPGKHRAPNMNKNRGFDGMWGGGMGNGPMGPMGGPMMDGGMGHMGPMGAPFMGMGPMGMMGGPMRPMGGHMRPAMMPGGGPNRPQF